MLPLQCTKCRVGSVITILQMKKLGLRECNLSKISGSVSDRDSV